MNVVQWLNTEDPHACNSTNKK